MIITERNGELRLTRQDDHARQAGGMARHWGDGSSHMPRLDGAVVLGVENHDFGWREPDGEALYDIGAGRPLDFRNLDPRMHLAFYRNGYENALALDPYAGLMVGMHWIGLYTRRFGYDPTLSIEIPRDLAPTFDEAIAEQQKEWVDIKSGLWSMDESRRDFEDRIWRDYEIVQLMDRLSLFLHLTDPGVEDEATIEPFRFRVDAPMERLSVRSHGNGEVAVNPFPFDEAFRTAITVRRLPDRRYETREELRGVLETIEDEAIEFLIRPASHEN